MIYLNRQSLSMVQIQTKIYLREEKSCFFILWVCSDKTFTSILFFASWRTGNFPRFRSYCNFFERKLTLRIRKLKDQKHFIFQRQKYVFIQPIHFYSIKLFIFLKIMTHSCNRTDIWIDFLKVVLLIGFLKTD